MSSMDLRCKGFILKECYCKTLIPDKKERRRTYTTAIPSTPRGSFLLRSEPSLKTAQSDSITGCPPRGYSWRTNGEYGLHLVYVSATGPRRIKTAVSESFAKLLGSVIMAYELELHFEGLPQGKFRNFAASDAGAGRLSCRSGRPRYDLILRS